MARPQMRSRWRIQYKLELRYSCGSVRLVGTFTSVTFLLQAAPGTIEGAGGDGVEIAFSLNRTPDAINNSYTTTENAVRTGNVITDNTGSGADTDPESDTLTVNAVNGVNANVGQSVTLASGATLTVNANGSYTYNPGTAFDSLVAGATVNETFTYTIRDANGPWILRPPRSRFKARTTHPLSRDWMGSSILHRRRNSCTNRFCILVNRCRLSRLQHRYAHRFHCGWGRLE